MTSYARVVDGIVRELFEVPPQLGGRPIEQLFNAAAGTWVDVTAMEPKPAYGWTYDGKAFAPPPPEEPDDARIGWARKLGSRV